MAAGIRRLGLLTSVILFFFFVFFIFSSSVVRICDAGLYSPPDNYLIACGSPTNAIVGQRTFVSDASLPASLITLTAPQSVTANTTSNSIPSSVAGDAAALYQSARIFTSPSSYSFKIQQPGRHFIRLYFFPFPNKIHNLAAANFTVSTQDFVLLPAGAGAASAPLLKEFSANITGDTLILSFVPNGGTNSSVAFVNAIEVVSAPDNLILNTAQTVSPVGNYEGLWGVPLETAYRVNMGGPFISPNNDTLWRTWVTDPSFLLDRNLAKFVPFTGSLNYEDGHADQNSAPYSVYSTATELATTTSTSAANFNVTWQFDVDGGATYLIRMHFCDFVSKALNQLYFSAYIGSYSASSNIDLSTLCSNTLASPFFMDFVFTVGPGDRKLNVSIGPSNLVNVMPDGILNGLEIMKMNNTGSVVVVSPKGSKSKVGIAVGAAVGVAVVLAVAVLVFFFLRRRKLGEKQQSKTWVPFSMTGGNSQSIGSRVSNGTTGTANLVGYRFPFSVLQEATNSFDENWVIGVGGFGKVYRGVLRDETKVAVKRGNPKSQQGLNEFRTEIELLSRLRHRHLVSLIGYCDERNEMILVYEYMEQGTLKNHLYGSQLDNLSWKQRLDICIGSARGLHYLHTGQAKAIIHRDVKSANILLDENLMAKVADFGLSKTGPELDQTHVSTAVKGSFGYLDPEYYRRQQLTEKSDVYSFGVVLLEAICARPVIDPTLPREMVNLAEWGMKFQKSGGLDQIVDRRIAGTIKPDSLRKFGETIEKCLADYGSERPSMGDVLWNLEYALQLQNADSSVSEVNSINRITELSSQVQNIGRLETAAVGGETVTVAAAGGNDNDLTDVSMSRVFSQLIKSEGR